LGEEGLTVPQIFKEPQEKGTFPGWSKERDKKRGGDWGKLTENVFLATPKKDLKPAGIEMLSLNLLVGLNRFSAPGNGWVVAE